MDDEPIVLVDLEQELAQLEWEAEVAEMRYQEAVEQRVAGQFEYIFGGEEVWNR